VSAASAAVREVTTAALASALPSGAGRRVAAGVIDRFHSGILFWRNRKKRIAFGVPDSFLARVE